MEARAVMAHELHAASRAAQQMHAGLGGSNALDTLSPAGTAATMTKRRAVMACPKKMTMPHRAAPPKKRDSLRMRPSVHEKLGQH